MTDENHARLDPIWEGTVDQEKYRITETVPGVFAVERRESETEWSWQMTHEEEAEVYRQAFLSELRPEAPKGPINADEVRRALMKAFFITKWIEAVRVKCSHKTASGESTLGQSDGMGAGERLCTVCQRWVEE